MSSLIALCLLVTECVTNLQQPSSSSHWLRERRSQSSESQRSQMMDSTKLQSSSSKERQGPVKTSSLTATSLNVPIMTTVDLSSDDDPHIYEHKYSSAVPIQYSCKFNHIIPHNKHAQTVHNSIVTLRWRVLINIHNSC